MASIGLGMATGRALWEQARRTQEENERFLMGRNQFEQELRLQELQTQQALIEQETVTQNAAILEPYRERIMKGDVEAYAQFLTDMSVEDDAVYTVQGNEIMKGYMSPDGEMVWDGVVLDTTGFSGPALLSAAYQYVESTSQIVANYRTTAAANAERLDKYQFETFKTDEQIRLKQAESAIQLSAVAAQNRISGGGGPTSIEKIREMILLRRGLVENTIDGVTQLYDMRTGEVVSPEVFEQVQMETYAVHQQSLMTGVSPSDIIMGNWGASYGSGEETPGALGSAGAGGAITLGSASGAAGSPLFEAPVPSAATPGLVVDPSTGRTGLVDPNTGLFYETDVRGRPARSADSRGVDTKIMDWLYNNVPGAATAIDMASQGLEDVIFEPAGNLLSPLSGLTNPVVQGVTEAFEAANSPYQPSAGRSASRVSSTIIPGLAVPTQESIMSGTGNPVVESPGNPWSYRYYR